MSIRRKYGSKAVWRRTGCAPGEERCAVTGRHGAGAVAERPEESEVGDALVRAQRRACRLGGSDARQHRGHGETELADVFHDFLPFVSKWEPLGVWLH